MYPHATLIARFSALRRLEIASANLAIGTASMFVAAVAVLSLAVDRGDAGPGIAGGNWSLRGTLAPFDQSGAADEYALPVPLDDAVTRLS